MRMPREVERLLNEGAELSADDAERLERALEQRPDDLDTRARLLGYHQACYSEAHRTSDTAARLARGRARLRGEMSSHDLALARHAIWLASNAPHAPIAAHDLCHSRTGEPPYAELSAIWRRHAAPDPPDATLLAHAIGFFWWANESFADELLARAEQAFPDDPRWVRFRQERRAQELSNENRFEPLRALGVNPGNEDDADIDKEERRKKRRNEIERLLREGDPEWEWAPELHEIAGSISLARGELDRARAHAEQLLVIDLGENARTLSDAAHNGHLLLGRIALRANDVDRAKAHLALAGQAGATGLIPIFGPDMRLANELLARGERDVVIRYLTAARSFWERGPVDEWIAEIRAGGIPDFGRNLRR